MNVDFITLACFCDHLDRLLGARVQQVLLPDERSVGLELYAGERHYLLSSADPQNPRLLLVPQRLRRGVAGAPPLLLLLRKWVRGARLVDVTQPPWERILMLHFDGPAGACRLVVELVGRYSNVALVDPEGDVLEATKHVGPDMTRYRVTLPGRPYQLPPLPPGRVPPTQVTSEGWAERLSRAEPDAPLGRWLIRQILGVGPMLGREIAARATGDPQALTGDAPPAAVAEAVRELFTPLEDGWWAPHVALDEAGQVIAFSPYKPHQFSRVEPTPDVNQAMWRYFQAQGMADPYAAARQAVQDLIDDARDRLEIQVEQLQGQRVDQQEVDDFRIAGELLLTYQHRVSAGAQEVTVPDYEGQSRTISLDPERTPVENAQAYFRRYEKAGRAARRIPALLRRAQHDRVYLEQLESDLALAESRPEIDAVQEALVEAGWAPKRRQKSGGQVSGPRRFEVAGLAIFVGRNARQNEQLTFQRAGPEDFWLHVRGRPGAHVIIRRGRQEVPERVLRRAAELAVHYSAARDSHGEVAVDVTERRFVRRLRGGRPGLVTYRNERTLWVQQETDSDA